MKSIAGALARRNEGAGMLVELSVEELETVKLLALFFQDRSQRRSIEFGLGYPGRNLGDVTEHIEQWYDRVEGLAAKVNIVIDEAARSGVHDYCIEGDDT